MKKSIYPTALKFVAVFAITGAAAYFTASVFSKSFATFTAYLVQALLSILGIQTTLVFSVNPHLISPLFDAELIELCWGLLEIAVVTGIVLASEDRTLWQRIYGVVLGVITVLTFNITRIAVTLKLFNPLEPFASTIAHDVLFRISLIIVIVGYYAAWYAVLTKTPKTLPKQKHARTTRK